MGSRANRVGAYARAAAVAAGLAALLVVALAFTSSPLPVEEEAKPHIVKMKNWKMSGNAAKNEMAAFFDNQNAASEVCLLASFEGFEQAGF